MAEEVSFDETYFYNTLKIGITVPVILRLNDSLVEIEAKIDTGAENCIFERRHGETLGLEIESGEEKIFSTVTAPFVTYQHELMLNVLGVEIFSTVYFAKEESFTRNVLGRQGWLDRVKLGLIDYEGKLLLNAYDL
ncbi:MAG: hypothetical protein LH614_22130 [Pyrinomonadaceae bacterium]|nr:hypothetical protein [Pyrinomonadaceae bacterium]